MVIDCIDQMTRAFELIGKLNESLNALIPRTNRGSTLLKNVLNPDFL